MAQIFPPADHGSAFQHIGIAIGAPGIAHIIIATKHTHTSAAQQHERRHGRTARTMRHQSNTAGCHHLRCRLLF